MANITMQSASLDLQCIFSEGIAIHSLMYKLLICSKRNALNCNAQGFIDLEGNFQYVTKNGISSADPINPHCHQRNENISEEAMFFQQLHAVVVHSYLSYSAIYHELKDLYPSASKANSLPAVVLRMRQWRAGRKFPCVTGGLETIFDLVENDPNWKKIKCFDNRFMTFKSINHKAAVRGIVFGDVEFTASIDAALHQTVFVEEAPITISGLKESRLIIATVPHKNYAFPVAWAIIVDDSKSESYCELLRGGISQILGNVQPETIYYDFGAEMFRALTVQYPASRVRGTFDAYCNLLYTNVSNTVQLRGENKEDAVRIFLKLIILSLLPPEKIVETFYGIVQNLSEPLFAIFRTALQYYVAEWLNKVGVSNLSFYHDLTALANCSKLHCTRLKNISGGTPDFWNFLGSTITIQNHSSKDFEKLKSKKSISNGTSRVGMLIDVEKIKKLQSKLITEEITSLEFLSQSVSAVERHVADLIFQNPPPKKNHQIVELVPIHHKLWMTVDQIRALESNGPEVLLGQHLPEDARADADEVNLEDEVDAEFDGNDGGPQGEMLVGEPVVLDAGTDTREAELDEENGLEVPVVENFGIAAGGRYYKVTNLCLICGLNDLPPDVIYNPCRHCIIYQECQRQFVDRVITNGEIFKCAYCRADVLTVDLII
ncbi:uncharacterized protein LOC123272558 isoform X2 [Cotesia glomerata]|uniref:uncharacterized protein LOC123272558 isoform X2 n=1 Tax=Cotesia glomerata TaxID=32391 RepID=UPI001D02C1C6|nr:uncharacterized protein LOC123272558 isoform X2 [Cotesia glomerata]